MSEHSVEFAHGMHVVHDGPQQAPPLLLIHGSRGSGASWGPVVPALSAHHHVIRVDLPGCGQSPPPASYDVPSRAGRVAALLELTPTAVAVAPWLAIDDVAWPRRSRLSARDVERSGPPIRTS
ncbi:alpha/beta fold hydrolase [Streptomyces sp. NPDC005426]|uniref:alpha/beta fold hydrolase n=1 Tax=Streptomyces sp. NPDC005426 TaxID=3155344 RepID=UPI0033A5FFD2